MTDDLVPRLLALARAEHDDLSVAEEAADFIRRLTEALYFYADPESWDTMEHMPILGRRWDRWCYGNEVAQWVLAGIRGPREGFNEGPEHPPAGRA